MTTTLEQLQSQSDCFSRALARRRIVKRASPVVRVTAAGDDLSPCPLLPIQYPSPNSWEVDYDGYYHEQLQHWC
ncbi:hypothetical protein WAI453_003475 [Rhynchosporium graminicola]